MYGMLRAEYIVYDVLKNILSICPRAGLPLKFVEIGGKEKKQR